MKKALLLPLLLAALCVSCKSDPKGKAKKEFKSNCVDRAQKELVETEVDKDDYKDAIKAYCDCSADMIIDPLSDADLKDYLENPASKVSVQADALSQPCLEAFKAEMNAKHVQQ